MKHWRWILTLLFGVLVALASAQTFQRSLPFLARTSSTSFSPLSVTHHWWVFSDMPTNINVTNWVARGSGAAWTNSAAASTQPTNSSLGVHFLRASSQRLTNAVSGQIFFAAQSSQFLIIQRDLNNSYCDVFATAAAGGALNWGYDNANKNFFQIASLFPDGPAPLSSFYDMVVVTYSNTCFILFTNGVGAYTNTTSGLKGDWRFFGGAANGYFTGYIKDFAINTNRSWSLSEIDSLHQYATNTYGISP